MSQKLTPEQIDAAFGRIERLADLTDSRFRIPVIGVRFGIDALIGLIPVLGDGVSALIALYLFFEAVRLGVPWPVRLRMLFNIAFDFFVGLVPLLGDFLDVAFRANQRNTRLLRDWLAQQQVPAPQSGVGSAGVPVLLSVLVVSVCAWVSYLLWQALSAS